MTESLSSERVNDVLNVHPIALAERRLVTHNLTDLLEELKHIRGLRRRKAKDGHPRPALHIHVLARRPASHVGETSCLDP
jgi:hypothetical protein